MFSEWNSSEFKAVKKQYQNIFILYPAWGLSSVGRAVHFSTLLFRSLANCLVSLCLNFSHKIDMISFSDFIWGL